ncbi:MAG: hypothetical protein KBC41_04415 [Candidatus Pacebacteria bacterium]|nr:hypothetical protein [Candidatus Paceibacterota bacterium]
MNTLKSTDKKILETLFEMKGGFVLDFSDRTMSDFFKEQFNIDIYDKKYDFDFPSRSKANRLRGIWLAEDEKTTGAIILALVDYAETILPQDKKEEIKDLSKKARDIGMNLLFSEITNDLQPEIIDLKNKTQCIKDFNTYDFQSLKTNEKIYHLKVLYSYYEAIIRTYYGSGLFFVTNGIDTLNDYFKILRKKIVEIIDSEDTLAEIKNSNAYGEVFEPITSLYTSVEFLDVVWEDAIVPSLINLREVIADKDLFENNSEMHKTSFAVVNFLKAISKEIEILRKYNEEQTKNFYKNDLPKHKEQFDSAFNQNKEQIHKIEIVGMPELQVKKTEDNVFIKGNKKIHPPKFTQTDWSKIEIRFLNERDVLITTNKKEVKPADYEVLGFSDDKKNKPNTAWLFLFGLSKNNGESGKLPKPIPDTIKQQKLSLSQKLKAIFKNETDPFYDSTETQTYKIKIKLIPPQGENENEDKYGTREYLEETMTEQYEE